MAALDLHEQEQVDLLRAWWRNNGRGIMLVVAVALVALAATQIWRSHKMKQAGEAATLFESVNTQLVSGDPKRVNDAAQMMMTNYAFSAFTPRAALLAAQANLDANDAARAKTQLQWVLDHSDEDGLKSLARLKLAALLLDGKDYAGALAQLDGKHPESFDSLYADLRGDVLNAQGRAAEARAAWQQAYDKADAQGPYRNLIQMKMDSLGEAK